MHLTKMISYLDSNPEDNSNNSLKGILVDCNKCILKILNLYLAITSKLLKRMRKSKLFNKNRKDSNKLRKCPNLISLVCWVLVFLNLSNLRNHLNFTQILLKLIKGKVLIKTGSKQCLRKIRKSILFLSKMKDFYLGTILSQQLLRLRRGTLTYR